MMIKTSNYWQQYYKDNKERLNAKSRKWYKDNQAHANKLHVECNKRRKVKLEDGTQT